MTTHELARQLLDRPEMTVAVLSVFDESEASAPSLAEVEMQNKDGQPETVMLISAAITLRE